MKKSYFSRILSLVLLFLFLSGVQPLKAEGSDTDPDWTFSTTYYVWAAGMHGTVGENHHRGQTYTIDKIINSRNHSAYNNRPGETSASSGSDLHNPRSRKSHDLFDRYFQVAYGFDICFRPCYRCTKDKNISLYVNCVGLTPLVLLVLLQNTSLRKNLLRGLVLDKNR